MRFGGQRACRPHPIYEAASFERFSDVRPARSSGWGASDWAIWAIASRWEMAFPNFASKQAQATGCVLDRTAERWSSFCVAASTQRKDIADAKRYWRDYDDYLIESLKDRRLAEAYLNAALEEDDARVFLLALRDVAQARGMSKLAARSKLNRESLYKMLSKRGNPACRVSAPC